MKKLSAILVLGLLFNTTANAKESYFKCINVEGKERSYILTIDLHKKIMKRASVEYEIIRVDETEIYGEIKKPNRRLLIVFDRFTAELTFYATAPKQKGENTKILDKAIYKCDKIERVL